MECLRGRKGAPALGESQNRSVGNALICQLRSSGALHARLRSFSIRTPELLIRDSGSYHFEFECLYLHDSGDLHSVFRSSLFGTQEPFIYDPGDF